jgi:phosphonopyruvate decarboxylase
MIDVKDFYNHLKESGIGFFAGVPDSLLKEFCAYVDDYSLEAEHITCANEGNAIAMAAGYHLASSKVGLVYMQNSGLGNATNPLLSLVDREVYGIPMILMIGWRGEPGVKDEPQHVKQGRVQLALLEAMEIPYEVIDAQSADYKEIITSLQERALRESRPVAIVVRKGAFSEYKKQNKAKCEYSLSREEALEAILEADSSYAIVSTTGKTSRELYEIRERRGEKAQDFLTVGSMGHSSSIAASIALAITEMRVMCIDGDGALLMHMGALAVIGSLKPENFVHVLINNYCHESVGGQKSAIAALDIDLLAKAAGYRLYLCAENKEELTRAILEIKEMEGPVFLEVRVKAGSRADLGRPKSSTVENKTAFMQKLGSI